MGVDGCLISWVNYKDELQQWIDEVLPLMEQAGQRQRYRARKCQVPGAMGWSKPASVLPCLSFKGEAFS
jgi:hypothetical protein